MSEQTNDQTVNDDQGNNENPNWRRDLEQRLENEKQARLEAERKYAFGVVPGLDAENNKLHKWFVDKYDGPLDPSEIANAASELGVLQAQQAEANNSQQQSSDAQDHARFDSASQGAQAADIQGSDEAKMNAILNGNFNSLAEYESAVKDAGLAQNNYNG